MASDSYRIPDATDAIQLHGRLTDLKALDARLYDVEASSAYTDRVLVATANSTTHLGALTERVLESMKSLRLKVYNNSAGGGAKWRIVDGGEIIVHLFLAGERARLDFDSLFQEARGASKSS